MKGPQLSKWNAECMGGDDTAEIVHLSDSAGARFHFTVTAATVADMGACHGHVIATRRWVGRSRGSCRPNEASRDVFGLCHTMDPWNWPQT